MASGAPNMKKILIGAAIGFAALVLISVVVGGMWAKSKVDSFIGGVEAVSNHAEETEKRVTVLNEKFAFKKPAKGVPVSLTERRLEEYLAIRAALQPVYATFEKKSKELETSAGSKPGLGTAMAAMGQLATFVQSLHETWLDQLESKKMAPAEYHSITAALYTSNWGVAAGEMVKQQRPMFEQLKSSLEEQLEATEDSEGRRFIEEQLASVKTQLAALPPADAAPTAAQKVHQANHLLYEKHKDKIEGYTMQGLDFMLLGTGEGGGSLGEALEHLQY